MEDLTFSSRKMIENTIYHLKDDFSEPNIRGFLDRYPNPSTRKSKIWSIIKFFILEKKEVPIYLMNLYEEAKNEDIQYRLDKKHSLKFDVSWKDVEEKRELMDKKSTEYLVVSMFTKIPPPRTSEWNENLGNKVVDGKLYVNRSKTGFRTIDLPADLVELIKKHGPIKNYNRVVPKIMKDFITFLSPNMKPTIGELRKLYVSSHGTSVENARDMGHKVSTSLLDYEN